MSPSKVGDKIENEFIWKVCLLAVYFVCELWRDNGYFVTGWFGAKGFMVCRCWYLQIVALNPCCLDWKPPWACHCLLMLILNSVVWLICWRPQDGWIGLHWPVLHISKTSHNLFAHPQIAPLYPYRRGRVTLNTHFKPIVMNGWQFSDLDWVNPTCIFLTSPTFIVHMTISICVCKCMDWAGPNLPGSNTLPLIKQERKKELQISEL